MLRLWGSLTFYESEACSHLSYHCEAYSQLCSLEVEGLTHTWITTVRLTHIYILRVWGSLTLSYHCEAHSHLHIASVRLTHTELPLWCSLTVMQATGCEAHSHLSYHSSMEGLLWINYNSKLRYWNISICACWSRDQGLGQLLGAGSGLGLASWIRGCARVRARLPLNWRIILWFYSVACITSCTWALSYFTSWYHAQMLYRKSLSYLRHS